ncbi:MAG TPA: hypothetical protein PLV92_10975, partial [Pirellulaceae bacterium]|nr:hypothetical protein [Pirellulaceae bacterium]
WFERAYRQADRALTDQALRGVGFASESVANAATRELEGWYDLLEIMARDERLLNGLESLESESTPGGWLSEMNDAELPEESRDELRRRLLVHPGQRQLQEVLSEYRAKAPKVFGWFVLERNGLQVAREPENKTIGMNYAWRTYYHGEEIDYADQRSYEGSARRRIRATHLSAAFVSQITDRWVVVISTPVYRYSDSQPQAVFDDDNFLGVVALMFELGEITQIPDSDAERVFSALVDTRVGRRGAILQHPLYESLLRASDRRLPDRFQDLRVDLDGWKPISHGSQLSLKSNYRDPLGKDPEGAMFDRRWLAAKAPVQVRGVDTGLWAIVQQSYDQTIGNELARLHEKIVLVAFASLALIVCLVIPTWAIVLRVTR